MDPHCLSQTSKFLLESLVPLDQVLDGLVTILLALQVFEFSLESFDMLLGPRPDRSLCLAIIGSLASKL